MHFYHVAKLELIAERQEYLDNLPKDTLYLDNLEVLTLHICRLKCWLCVSSLY